MLCCAFASYLAGQLIMALSVLLGAVFPGVRERLERKPAVIAADWRPGQDDPHGEVGLSARRRTIVVVAGFVALASLAGAVAHGLHGHTLRTIDGVPVLVCSGTVAD